MSGSEDFDGMPMVQPGLTQKRDGLLLRQWNGSIRYLSGPETVAHLLGLKKTEDLKGAHRGH
jgi:hypothetical protein